MLPKKTENAHTAVNKIFLLQSSVIAILLLMNFLPEEFSSDIALRFGLNREANIPTWYSSVLLFSVFAVSVLINYSFNKSCIKPKWKSFWLFFGAVFCFLSMDEAAQLHELINKLTGIKWVYLYAPFGAIFFVVCIIYFVKIEKESRKIRNWILGGLIVFATGGMIFELVSHLFSPLPLLLQNVEFVLEEGMEMFGVLMILTGCLHKLNSLSALQSEFE